MANQSDVHKRMSYKHWKAIYTTFNPRFKRKQDTLRALLMVWQEKDRCHGYGYGRNAYSYLDSLYWLIREELNMNTTKAMAFIDDTIQSYRTSIDEYRGGTYYNRPLFRK